MASASLMFADMKGSLLLYAPDDDVRRCCLVVSAVISISKQRPLKGLKGCHYQ